jgi:NAD(P)-dependent dehydrogenase (short-subunit alcohol dehydrogenase family)
MSSQKRKAIITGGSKGIGKAIAKRFAQEKIDIYLLASNEENLEKTTSELKSKYKVNIHYHASDLKTKEGCNSAINSIENEFHDFDTLIFSAGATKSGDFLKQPIEDFEDGFALKFYSAIRLSKAFWPTLSKNKGWVVSINGAMSHSPDPFFMVGGAVNAAFLNFSKALSKRGLVDGVNVNSINPGMTSTDRLITIIQSNADREGISFAEAEKKALENIGLDRFGTPEEVAELTYFLCNPNMRHLTGTEINLDGGKKTTI